MPNRVEPYTVKMQALLETRTDLVDNLDSLEQSLRDWFNNGLYAG
jgi:hypothetical protein